MICKLFVCGLSPFQLSRVAFAPPFRLPLPFFPLVFALANCSLSSTFFAATNLLLYLCLTSLIGVALYTFVVGFFFQIEKLWWIVTSDLATSARFCRMLTPHFFGGQSDADYF
jgi:hypothetical protein